MEPTNRELKIMMDNLENKFDERFEDIMKTLGKLDIKLDKLGSLDEKVTSLDLRRRFDKKMVYIVVSIITTVVGIIIYLAWDNLKLTQGNVAKNAVEAVLNERCGNPCVTAQK